MKIIRHTTAILAAAVTTPDCLNPPPILFLTHLACLINFSFPTSILPIGAPNPFEKHKLTLSNSLV